MYYTEDLQITKNYLFVWIFISSFLTWLYRIHLVGDRCRSQNHPYAWERKFCTCPLQVFDWCFVGLLLICCWFVVDLLFVCLCNSFWTSINYFSAMDGTVPRNWSVSQCYYQIRILLLFFPARSLPFFCCLFVCLFIVDSSFFETKKILSHHRRLCSACWKGVVEFWTQVWGSFGPRKHWSCIKREISSFYSMDRYERGQRTSKGEGKKAREWKQFINVTLQIVFINLSLSFQQRLNSTSIPAPLFLPFSKNIFIHLQFFFYILYTLHYHSDRRSFVAAVWDLFVWYREAQGDSNAFW